MSQAAERVMPAARLPGLAPFPPWPPPGRPLAARSPPAERLRWIKAPHAVLFQPALLRTEEACRVNRACDHRVCGERAGADRRRRCACQPRRARDHRVVSVCRRRIAVAAVALMTVPPPGASAHWC